MDCLFVESACDLLKGDFLIKWIEILAIMAGGAFALYRWRSNALVKRSLEFHQLIKEIQNDKDVKKLLYTFDDDTKLWFLEEFVGDSAVAPVLDKLLFHFSYVVYLRKKKIITKDEFATLSYEIDRSLQNPQLQDYLYNLKMYSEKRGLQHPYKTPTEQPFPVCTVLRIGWMSKKNIVNRIIKSLQMNPTGWLVKMIKECKSLCHHRNPLLDSVVEM